MSFASRPDGLASRPDRSHPAPRRPARFASAFGRLRGYLFGPETEFRERLFTVVALIGAVLAFGAAIDAVVREAGPVHVAANSTAGVVALVLLWHAKRSRRLTQTYLIAVVIVFVGVFGAMFIGGRMGLFSTVPMYFLLALVLTALMFDGTWARVILPMLIVVYIAMFVVVFLRTGQASGPVADWGFLANLIIGFVGSGTAITLAVAAQVRLYRRNEAVLAARNRTLEELDRIRVEFLGNVSHELRTPMTVISSYAQHAQRSLVDSHTGDPILPEQLAADLALIATQSNRLAHMVAQLLDAARIEEGKMAVEPRPVELAAVIQETLGGYHETVTRSGNELAVDPNSATPVVLADPMRIGQVLVNLLINAARHTRNGLITISVREIGSFAQVNVADSGEGMTPDRLATVFERYKTSAPRTRAAQVDAAHPANAGIGLGLFISRSIVVEHGGQMSVASLLDKGTTVTFTLPLAPASVK